jgi:hypothetical protein
LARECKRLALVNKGLLKSAGFPKKRFSPGSLATRLASIFFLATAVAYPQVPMLAQQAGANAARAKAEAARPDEEFCHTAPTSFPPPPPPLTSPAYLFL